MRACSGKGMHLSHRLQCFLKLQMHFRMPSIDNDSSKFCLTIDIFSKQDSKFCFEC